MKTKKILSLIVMALVVITAGLFAGCGDKYSKMTIELDKEEITLLLNGTEEEKTTSFTATVSGIGEDVSGGVIFEQTDMSVAIFELISFTDNVSTIKVTALMGGTTTAKIKSEEAPNRVFAEIVVNVIEAVKSIEYNPILKPYVKISDPTILNLEARKNFVPEVMVLNAAEFISFSPATTTQKGIIYSLVNKYPGIMVDKATGSIYLSNDALKITEAGEVTMTGVMANAGYATVRATSASNPELFVEFELRIIYPIESITNMGFSENGQPISEMILSNGRFREGYCRWHLDWIEEDYNLVCWSDNDLILEVEKNSNTSFSIRSGIEGTTTFYVKVEVVGYEQHYTMASIPVRVVQFPEQIYFDKVAYANEPKVEYIYDDYQNGLGLPITITAGPIGAYNKNIILEFVNQVDRLKYLDDNGNFNTQYLKLRYDSNTYVNINDVIDGSGNGTKIYAMSAGNYAEPLTLKFLAEWTKKYENDVIDEEVYSLMQFNLKVGARKINIDYPDDRFYIGKGETAKLYYSLEGINQNSNVFANKIYANAKDNTIIEISNETDVLLNEDENGKYIEIKGLKEGATQVELSLSNGIKTSYDIHVFEQVDDFSIDINSMEENNPIAELSFVNNNGLKTVESATVKVNSTLKINLNKFKLTDGIYISTDSGTVSSVVYSLTDNDETNDYATVNTNGVLRTYLATPNDVVVTIKVLVKYLSLSGNGVANLEEKEFTFNLKIYVPISNVELNTYEITLYDYDTLRYYDKHKGQLQIYTNNYDKIEENLTKVLCVNVYPQNATNKNIQINFSNVSALENQGDNLYRAVSSGLGTDIIPCDIEIIVQDFNVYYVKICRIYVKFPNLSSNISLLNIERVVMEDNNQMPYIYFDARKGLNNSTNTFKIEATAVGAGTFGTTLLNSDIVYKYIQHSDDTSINPVLSISNDGIITPLRAGIAYIDVIAKDSFTNSTDYSNFKRIKIKVADGRTEITAIEINNAKEFMDINTIEGLTLNYVITDTLNFALVNFAPLGLINNEIVGFSGTINGADENGKHYLNGLSFNNFSTVQNNYFGLILKNDGIIKNLNITISNVDYTLINSDASLLNFGVVSAINNGIIDNCNVEILNSVINTNVNINNIGVITGLNNENAKIQNCRVLGSLIINQGQSVVSGQTFSVGGLVGKNLSKIIGSYDFYNEFADYNNSNSNSNINIIFNKNNVSSSNYHELIMQNSCFGLIAGYSYGLIDGIYSSGEIVVNGYSNVGGIVGIANESIIQNCYFNGSIQALTYLGGIAGKIISTNITNCVVEMFDENTVTISAKIKGQNYVAGLIGGAYSSNIEGCFVASYVSRKVGESFKGDILIEYTATANSQEIFIGGLVAELKASFITTCYSNTNISINLSHAVINNQIVFANGYVGGIAGIMNNQHNEQQLGIIDNVYAMGTITASCVDANGNAINNPTNVIIGGIVGYYNLSVNTDGSFFNTYNTLANNVIGLNLTDENPEENFKYNYTNSSEKENIIFNDTCWQNTVDINNGYPYLNFDENRMIVIVPDNLSIEIKESSILTSVDLLKQNKHIKIDDKKLILFYHANENQNYLNLFQIDKLININFEPSEVNRSSLIFDISNTDVLKRLSTGDFKISGTGTTEITIISKYNFQATATFIIEVVLATTTLKVSALSDFSGGEVNAFNEIMKGDKIILYYQITGNNNLMLEYSVLSEEDKQIISVVRAPWQNGENFVDISSLKTQIIDCLQPSEGVSLIVKPFIYIKNSQGLITKQYLPFEKYLTIKIVLGTQSVKLTPEQSEISLKDIANFKINTVSDLSAEDISPKIKVELIGKDSQGLTIYEDAMNLVDLTTKAMDESGKQHNISIKIKETQKNNQLFLSQQILRVSVSVLKSHSLNSVNEKQYLTQEFFLTIKPQKISFVEMEYFSDGELYTDENGEINYNLNEIAGNIIKTGTIGILKIKFFPENSMDNISKVELTSNSNKGNISFQQVLFNGNGYETLTPYPTQIVGGTQLLAHSNSDGSYDGNLYVKSLIPSTIQEGVVYTLILKCYYKNSNLIYTTSLNLISATPKKLELTYKNSASYLNKEFLPNESDETLSLSITKLQDLSSLKIIAQNQIGQTITNNLIISKIIKSINGPNTTATFTIKAPETLVGQEINIFAEITEISGNKEFKYLSNVLKLTVVDKIIESVSLNETVVENGNLILRKPYGGTYALEFKVNTNQAKNLIDEFNNFNIAQNSNQKLAYWFNSANQNLKIFAETDNLTGLNYKTHVNESALIEPLRVSQDNLFGVMAYYYNNGKLTPFDYEGQNYPIANKPTGRYLLGDISVFIVKVAFKTDFYLQGQYENPVPIYNLEEFNSMRENGNYILMNNLYLGSDFKSIKTKIASFNGNGYVLEIGGFANLGEDNNAISNEGKFGLFEQIEEGVVLKNIKVSYVKQTLVDNVINYSGIELNISNYKNIYFGGIVAVNNGGIIYNCEVTTKINTEIYSLNIITQTLINNEIVSTYIGLIAAQNYGNIVHSKTVDLKLNVSKGYVAGLVAQNNGAVSHSYVKNINITHQASTDTSTLNSTSLLGGFAVQNTGTIIGSYIDCLQNATSLSFNGILGGFIVVNTGTISDCYSRVNMQSQVKTAGFVYSATKGLIKNCYSISYSPTASASRAPFVGVDGTMVLGTTSTINNCNYLQTTGSIFTNYTNYPATKLNAQEFKNEYYFNGFVFRGDNGIWKFNESDIAPQLIEANNIIVSKQKLLSRTNDKLTDQIIYTYIDEDPVNYLSGSKHNPILIVTGEQFVKYVLRNNATITGVNYVNTNYYNLLSNIDLSEYVLNGEYGNDIYETTLTGGIEGNGFTISGIKISAPSDITSINNAGLISKLENAVVKNLTLIPLQVYANNIKNVGTLAGYVGGNSMLINIKVEAKNIVVQGKNYVGGLAGVFTGNSIAENITAKVSVNASYKTTQNLVNNYDYSSNSSYVGGAFGIVDLNNINRLQKAPIYNIKIGGDIKLFGQFVGAAFGFVGENSFIDVIDVLIENNNFIKATFSAGGIASENRGHISRAKIEHTNQIDIDQRQNFAVAHTKQNINFFEGFPVLIGGIVGFNNGGTVDNSYCKIDVRNINSDYSGGLVGIMNGGNLYSCYSTSSVLSGQYIGGLIGVISNRNTLCEESSGIFNSKTIFNYTSKNNIKNNSSVNIINCVALNNWLLIDHGNLANSIHGGIMSSIENNQSIFVNTQDNYYLDSNLNLNSCFLDENNTFGINIEKENINNNVIFKYFSANVWENSKQFAFVYPSLKIVNPLVLKPVSLTNISINSISNVNEFISMGTVGNYTLTDNIYLYGINLDKYFNGTLNGNGYDIIGLTKNNSARHIGLFKQTTNSVLKNLGVVGVDYDLSIGNAGAGDATSIGALVGLAENTQISNCYVNGNIILTGGDSANIGGLVGKLNNSIIENCYSQINIIEKDATNVVIAGLVGVSEGESSISNSYFSGNLNLLNNENIKSDFVGNEEDCSISEVKRLFVGQDYAFNVNYSTIWTIDYRTGEKGLPLLRIAETGTRNDGIVIIVKNIISDKILDSIFINSNQNYDLIINKPNEIDLYIIKLGSVMIAELNQSNQSHTIQFGINNGMVSTLNLFNHNYYINIKTSEVHYNVKLSTFINGEIVEKDNIMLKQGGSKTVDELKSVFQNYSPTGYKFIGAKLLNGSEYFEINNLNRYSLTEETALNEFGIWTQNDDGEYLKVNDLYFKITARDRYSNVNGEFVQNSSGGYLKVATFDSDIYGIENNYLHQQEHDVELVSFYKVQIYTVNFCLPTSVVELKIGGESVALQDVIINGEIAYRTYSLPCNYNHLLEELEITYSSNYQFEGWYYANENGEIIDNNAISREEIGQMRINKSFWLTPRLV